GRFEKKRGAIRHPGFSGLVHHKPGSAAYANNGMYTLLRREFSYAAVQGLGLVAKLEHFTQHGNAPLGGNTTKQLQHGAYCLGVRVVAIVDNRYSVAFETLAAHLSGGKRPDGLAQPVRRNVQSPANGNRGQDITHAM